MDRKQVVTVNMMHTCPMTTGTVPHVGGPVIGPGSVGVKINGIPVALQGDTCQCQGPPDSIVQGCPGVTINGTPIAVQQSPTAHGGTIPQGVTGVVVVSKNESVFEISQEREPVIYNLQWIKDTLVVRDSKVLKVVTLGADTRNIADGEEVRIKVQATNQQITELSGKVQNNRVEVEWEVEAFEEEQQEEKEQRKQEREIIYVRDLEADKPEAQPNEKVTYKVTKYSQEKVTENDKKGIQWAIKIDGKQEVLKEKGEKLVLTIKEEWAGKELIVMPFLVKPDEKKVSKKVKINEKSHIRLVITNEITGYTIQNLKGLDYVFSDPAVIVPTYRVDVVNYDKNNTEGKIEISFSVTRDAWYNLGKEEKKYKLLNRAFIPKNWDQNLYGAYWIPSYPKFSGMGAFILTRFGERKLPAKPLLTQKLLNGKDIESPRKDENIATDVMIHIGGTYEIMGYDYLGGSYGCFGFIPESNIHKTPELAKKAIKNDTYDDNISNKVWKEITNKILNLSFESKKDIKILLEYRDENLSYKPKFIYEE